MDFTFVVVSPIYCSASPIILILLLLGGTLDEDFDYDGEGHETVGQDAAQADIIAYLMMFIGWFIILRAVSDYNRARKMERIITAEPTTDADAIV
jgi:hypothetical protein